MRFLWLGRGEKGEEGVECTLEMVIRIGQEQAVTDFETVRKRWKYRWEVPG